MKKPYIEPEMIVEVFEDFMRCQGEWGNDSFDGEGTTGFWDDVEDI